MIENSEYEDRRQLKRANVQNLVVSILKSDELDTIGSITDISLTGVRCTYDELRMAPPNTRIHSIDLIADSHYLLDIPCKYIWNIIVETEYYSQLTNMRQCGIQFGKLTPDQIFLLRSFINRHTSSGIKGMTANVQLM